MADENNTATLEADPIKEAAEEAENAPEEGQPARQAEEEIPADLGIEALKQQLEQERSARAEAERRAHLATRHAVRSDAEVQEGNLQIVVSAIETVKRDNLNNRRAYAEALQAQDFTKAAEINDVISMNNAKLLQLESGRQALEERVVAARNAPPPREEPPSDPVETVASQLSPRSAAWVRSHPECVRDQKMYSKMLGAHHLAVGEGLPADSDEYFEFIENQLGMRKPKAAPPPSDAQDEDPSAAAAKPVPRRVAPPAAPPSRGASNGAGRMTLTAAQREAAQISGLSEEEYARNLMADKKRRVN